METTEQTTTRDRTLAVFIAATAVAFIVIALRAELDTPDHDGLIYHHMANGSPESYTPSPFRNRPLTPTIVSFLPVPIGWGFVTMTALYVGVAVAAIDRFLRSLFTSRVALVGVAMFVTVPTLGWLLAAPFRVDGLTFATGAVVFACLAERRWLPIMALMPVAVFNHEMVLLLLIPIMLTAWRTKKIPEAAVTAGAAAGVYWLAHRSGVIPANDKPTFMDADYREHNFNWNAAFNGSIAGSVYQQYLDAFGVAGLLAPFGWRRVPQLVRDGAWMMVPAVVLCGQATQWARLFVPIVPVAVALACAAVVRAVGEVNTRDDDQAVVMP